MKEKRNRTGNFEERLLDELKTVVALRGAEQTDSIECASPTPARRRAPRLVVAATAVLAAAAGVLVFSSGGDNTPKAFAVEPQDGGGTTIEIYSPEDAAGLEGALGEAGIRSQVTWLPTGMTCREPHFTQSTAKTSMGGTIGGIRVGGPGKPMTIGVMSPRESQELWQEHMSGEISEKEYRAATPSFSLDPASFRPDQTVVISGARGPYYGNPEGGFEAQLSIAEGPVEPCEPVSVSNGGMLGETNRILEAEAAQGRR